MLRQLRVFRGALILAKIFLGECSVRYAYRQFYQCDKKDTI